MTSPTTYLQVVAIVQAFAALPQDERAELEETWTAISGAINGDLSLSGNLLADLRAIVAVKLLADELTARSRRVH